MMISRIVISIWAVVFLFIGSNLVIAQKAGEIVANSLGMNLAYVPAGTFQMGGKDSNGPIHTVTLSQGFYIGRTEVTQGEWVAVTGMGNNPSFFKNCDKCPVEQVSWGDVQEFIQKLNVKGEGTYRLPTEAEWEYSARAGTTGDYAGRLGEMTWYRSNSRSKTHEVATKQPNAWGFMICTGMSGSGHLIGLEAIQAEV